MVVRAPLSRVLSVVKPSIAVLVWVKKMNYNEEVFQPNLAIEVASSTGSQPIQIYAGKINDSINVHMTQGDNLFASSHWVLNSSVGVIPPGNYSFSIWLKCTTGQTLVYDEFRLFLIEIADKKKEFSSDEN